MTINEIKEKYDIQESFLRHLLSTGIISHREYDRFFDDLYQKTKEQIANVSTSIVIKPLNMTEKQLQKFRLNYSVQLATQKLGEDISNLGLATRLTSLAAQEAFIRVSNNECMCDLT